MMKMKFTPSMFEYSAVFLIPIAVFFLTQLMKFFIHSVKHGWNWRYAFAYGHMPSSHTAFVVSVVTSVGYFDGVDSGAFAVAVCLAFIVINDAVRLRMYMGDQGRYINLLVRKFDLKAEEFPRLKERIGHTPVEMAVGAFLGLFLTFIAIPWLA